MISTDFIIAFMYHNRYNRLYEFATQPLFTTRFDYNADTEMQDLIDDYSDLLVSHYKKCPSIDGLELKSTRYYK